jgi:MFS transporter, DHA3 family, macrolide efflux protein
MLTVCAYLPRFLLSFKAGVRADRYARKTLILLSDASIPVVTLLLTVLYPYVLDDPLLLGALMAASLICSGGAGIQTPAVGAIIPQRVPEQQLMRVCGVNAPPERAAR